MKSVIILTFFIIILSCTTKSKVLTKDSTITTVVSEIFHDSIIDNPNFEICGSQDRIIQYYAFNEKAYKGEKAALDQHFKSGYNSKRENGQSGLIRIRFIVNCKGEAGRFRILSMDPNYQKNKFDQSITKQLLSLTKNFNTWRAMQAREIYRDYYLYLIFKIENGNLIEIMP